MNNINPKKSKFAEKISLDKYLIFVSYCFVLVTTLADIDLILNNKLIV